jgi:hypothetical protein
MNDLECEVLLRYQFRSHYCNSYVILITENADEGDHKRIRISLCALAFCIKFLYHQKAVL